MALLGLTNGAYAWLTGPALQFLLTGGAFGFGKAAAFWPQLNQLPRDHLLVLLPIAVVAIGLVKGAAYLGQFYWSGLYGQRVIVDLRRQLFARLLDLSVLQRSRNLSGDLLSRFSADVAAVEVAAVYTVASYFRDTFQLIVLLAVAISASWQLTVFIAAVVPIAVWPAQRVTKSLLKRLRDSQSSLGRLAAQVQETVMALRTIKAFDASAAELSRFGRRASLVERALTRAAWLRGALPSLMELLAAVAIAAALVAVARWHLVEPAQLVSFLTAVVLAWQPAKDLGRFTGFGLQATAALERIDHILTLPPAVPDAQGAQPCRHINQGLRLQQVSFSWGDRPALSALTLDVPVGQVTALVGPSGGGKSTVVSLLLRFEEIAGGAFTVDGLDVRDFTSQSVRALFGLVTQEPLLFSATIRDNLLVARPQATDAELQAACTDANAWEFISALPNGLDTLLGERGATLSGGQRQRLCLARALLGRPQVLLLDEATSSLDPEGEKTVQQALERVLVGRTAVVVAHRLSSIARADRICVIEQGRVVEQGTHAELLALRGAYAQLWRQQTQAAPAA